MPKVVQRASKGHLFFYKYMILNNFLENWQGGKHFSKKSFFRIFARAKKAEQSHDQQACKNHVASPEKIFLRYTKYYGYLSKFNLKSCIYNKTHCPFLTPYLPFTYLFPTSFLPLKAKRE